MEWNKTLIQYTKEHSGTIVFGSTTRCNKEDHLSMVVPDEEGPILVCQEIRNVYNGVTIRDCAMMKITLNQPYKLEVNKQNVLKKGADLVFQEQIKFPHKEFMQRYSLKSNHPEYTKLALSDPTWMQFMMQLKQLSIYVYPVEQNGLDHTIKVHYKESIYPEIFSVQGKDEKEIDTLLECCRLTYQALRRYRIEDEESDLSL